MSKKRSQATARHRPITRGTRGKSQRINWGESTLLVIMKTSMASREKLRTYCSGILVRDKSSLATIPGAFFLT